MQLQKQVIVPRVTLVSSPEVGSWVGGDHRYVCHRVGWFLLRSVHVQLQPRSPMYPLSDSVKLLLLINIPFTDLYLRSEKKP